MIAKVKQHSLGSLFWTTISSYVLFDFLHEKRWKNDAYHLTTSWHIISHPKIIINCLKNRAMYTIMPFFFRVLYGKKWKKYILKSCVDTSLFGKLGSTPLSQSAFKENLSIGVDTYLFNKFITTIRLKAESKSALGRYSNICPYTVRFHLVEHEIALGTLILHRPAVFHTYLHSFQLETSTCQLRLSTLSKCIHYTRVP